MIIPVRYYSFAVLSFLMAGSPQIASASLLTNGTFDTDLLGWTIAPATTTGVTWVGQKARVGQPGTPGLAIFEQSFDIPSGTSQLEINFEYEWQINQPAQEDTFKVEAELRIDRGDCRPDLAESG